MKDPTDSWVYAVKDPALRRAIEANNDLVTDQMKHTYKSLKQSLMALGLALPLILIIAITAVVAEVWILFGFVAIYIALFYVALREIRQEYLFWKSMMLNTNSLAVAKGYFEGRKQRTW